MGLNKDDRKKITYLTDTTYNEDLAPKVRIANWFELYGLNLKLQGRVSARSVRAGNSLVAKFKTYSSAGLRTQKEIRAEAERLAETLKAALAAQQPSGENEEESDEMAGSVSDNIERDRRPRRVAAFRQLRRLVANQPSQPVAIVSDFHV